jgi:hypothetical protein
MVYYVRKCNLLHSAVTLLLFFATPSPLCAQTVNDFKPLVAATVTISSKVLNEERPIYIYTPPADSTNPGKRYPVLYLMDGESHFSLLAEYCRYLGRWDVNVIPEMIVVGIPNTNRTRDLTPTHSIVDYYGKPDTSSTSWLKPSGGNDNFLRFINDELMPYVNSHYKTAPFKIFAGHSFGGITAIDCFLTKPGMFNAYLAISPSFWWDKEYLLKLADKKLETGAKLDKILFYSDASEGSSDKSSFHTNLLKFDSLIAKKQLMGLAHKYAFYPEDIHMTEPVKAYYDALRFVYKQWELPPMGPKQINSAAIMAHYHMLSARYGYTILPNEVNIRNWAASLMQNKGTIDNAISLFEMNTKNYPVSYSAFADLAGAYLKNGEREKAIMCYKKVVGLNPSATGAKDQLTRLMNGNN